jgi:hypothetical protein
MPKRVRAADRPAERHRDHQARGREMGRAVARFVVGHGRDCEGWNVSLAEISRKFPHASLRALWATELLS